MLADEFEKALESEVQLFRVSELFPVAEVHSLSVSWWNRVQKSFLEASERAIDLGFDLLDDSLSSVGAEFCGICINRERVGRLSLYFKLFSVDLLHALDLAEGDNVSVLKSMPLFIVYCDEPLFFLRD